MDLTDILLTIIVAAGIPSLAALVRYMLNVGNRLTIVETELDIFLHHSGFDIPKVKEAIKKNMKEIKQNHGPTTGCINIKDLYRDKEV